MIPWHKHLVFEEGLQSAWLYEYLDFLMVHKNQEKSDLLREAKKHPIAKTLETAPGFGPIRTARLLPIVVTPHRFRTKRQFWSCCGLGIVTPGESARLQRNAKAKL